MVADDKQAGRQFRRSEQGLRTVIVLEMLKEIDTTEVGVQEAHTQILGWISASERGMLRGKLGQTGRA